ncbi:hypothetical protein BDZ89DRAFT_1051272 [Hymenopellis radicata]|nr:hypothetical protein BDZ89DRAFT_1051272 [Hymenopellis radicata]
MTHDYYESDADEEPDEPRSIHSEMHERMPLRLLVNYSSDEDESDEDGFDADVDDVDGAHFLPGEVDEDAFFGAAADEDVVLGSEVDEDDLRSINLSTQEEGMDTAWFEEVEDFTADLMEITASSDSEMEDVIDGNLQPQAGPSNLPPLRTSRLPRLPAKNSISPRLAAQGRDKSAYTDAVSPPRQRRAQPRPPAHQARPQPSAAPARFQPAPANRPRFSQTAGTQAHNASPSHQARAQPNVRPPPNQTRAQPNVRPLPNQTRAQPNVRLPPNQTRAPPVPANKPPPQRQARAQPVSGNNAPPSRQSHSQSPPATRTQGAAPPQPRTHPVPSNNQRRAGVQPVANGNTAPRHSRPQPASVNDPRDGSRRQEDAPTGWNAHTQQSDVGPTRKKTPKRVIRYSNVPTGLHLNVLGKQKKDPAALLRERVRQLLVTFPESEASHTKVDRFNTEPLSRYGPSAMRRQYDLEGDLGSNWNQQVINLLISEANRDPVIREFEASDVLHAVKMNFRYMRKLFRQSLLGEQDVHPDPETIAAERDALNAYNQRNKASPPFNLISTGR